MQRGYHDAIVVLLAKMFQHIAAAGGTTYSDIADTTGGPAMADRQALLLIRRLHALSEAAPGSEPADPTLVTRYRDSGDTAALDCLVRRHGPMVLRVARRVLANAHDVDDVFQATFLVLARRACSIRKGESLASWLHGVAYRLALKVRAMTTRRQVIERRARPRQTADPLDEMTARELLGLLDEELRRLPEKYRSAVLLCCVEGRTHAEAARQLGCPVGTLRSRLERGRELLGARLARRGVSPAAPLLAGLSATAVVPAALPSGGMLGSASIRAATLARSLEGGFSWAVSLGLFAAVAIAGLVAGVLLLPSPSAAPPASPARATQARRASPDDQDKLLPPGAAARLGTLRFRQGGWLRNLALSHDGRRLVTIGHEGSVRLWDAATGNELHSGEKGVTGLAGVALAPDGKTVAFASITSCTLLDMTTGRAVRTLDGAAGAKSLAFSPDGKTLATIRDRHVSLNREGGVALWSMATGAVLARHEVSGSLKIRAIAAALAWSGDGTRLAWADGEVVKIRDMRSGKVESCTARACQGFLAVTLSADGKWLAASSKDRRMRLWDVSTGKVFHTFEGHAVPPHCLALSPDGKLLASGSGDRSGGEDIELDGLRLWDTSTGKELAKLGRYAEGVMGLCFSPDGKRLYSGCEMSVRVWDVKTKKEILFGAGHHGWVGALAYSPDGRTLASAGSDTTVRLWDAAARTERRTLKGCEAPIDSLAYRPDGALLAAGARNGTVVVWELPGGKEVARLKACKDARDIRIDFSPDGKQLATMSRSGQITLWNATSLKEERQLPYRPVGAMCLAFTPDSKRLAIGRYGEANDQVRLVDVVRGEEVRRFYGVRNLFVPSLQFSPDGQFLAAGKSPSGGSIELWDVVTGHLRWRSKPPFPGGSIAYSPDGRMIAWTGESGNVGLWEAATGGERRRWKGQVGRNLTVAVSPDGRTVATGSMDTTVMLWDVRGLPAGPKAKPAEHWKALADRDAARAYDAILTLAAAPEASVAFLRTRLRPARALAGKLEDLLGDLDSDEFARREKATQALRELGKGTEPALRKVYQVSPSLEVRVRARRLLDELARERLSPEELRAVRAVEALEYCGTAGSRELLETFSRGAPEAVLTQEAKAALARRGAR
jgi:RNA polymerase sigma factor (sigma-70 family)